MKLDQQQPSLQATLVNHYRREMGDQKYTELQKKPRNFNKVFISFL